ncbi:interleukin-3 [Phodopus roborovskii]|uniref:interleukin-3 n=1 Tax=Phodopus roborovskii TaxID=109678 RepID=UPI0021E45A33|nr:interleukin-3 [Phodopus roborovskii]
MDLVSSSTSVLFVLLLSLMLFHQGLQNPLRHSDTCHSTSDGACTLNCSLIAIQIMEKLPKINLTYVDDRAILRVLSPSAVTFSALILPSSHPLPSSYMEDPLPSQNDTLQRVNLCEFLSMRAKLEEKKPELKVIKTNLEKLEYCLSTPVSASKMAGIYLEEDLEKFQKKLRFYVSQLNNLLPVPRPPPSPSDSVTSRPVVMECEDSTMTGV